MFFVDHPEPFSEILPGFLPHPLPGSGGSGGRGETGDFNEIVGKTLLGDENRLFWGFRVPEGFRGDFWKSWFLAARAPVSQYDQLREVIADNRSLPHHVVCLALEGAGFHGQDQRGWMAEKGNIHLTLGLRCDLSAADCGLALTMLPAVALVDALLKLGLPSSGPGVPGIKWVNDILVDQKKLGGVLTSVRTQEGRIQSAVLGLGLNVAVAPRVDPTVFTPGVTCLGDQISLSDKVMTNVLALALASVAARFEQLHDLGPSALFAAYRESSLILGKTVEIHEGDKGAGAVRRGRVLDIGPDLSLVLSDDPRPVTDGRLVFLPGDV